MKRGFVLFVVCRHFSSAVKADISQSETDNSSYHYDTVSDIKILISCSATDVTAAAADRRTR